VRHERFDDAIGQYREALTGLYEHDPNLMLGLAQAQFAKGDAAGARGTLDELIRLNPDFRSPVGHLLYARALESEGNVHKALEEYRVLANSYPGAEAAVRYAQSRKAFGRPIADFQALRFYLADMATEVDAARLLTRKAAAAKDSVKKSGGRYSMEAAVAKLYAAEMAQRVTTKALQIHGGYGYTKEYPVERNFRDARITEIYEGTSEIHRLIIAREVFKDAGLQIG